MNSKMILVLGVGLLIAFMLYKYVGDDLNPMQRAVTNELRNYDLQNIDVKTIPAAKLEEINILLFSGKSAADIKGGVQAILNRGS